MSSSLNSHLLLHSFLMSCQSLPLLSVQFSWQIVVHIHDVPFTIRIISSFQTVWQSVLHGIENLDIYLWRTAYCTFQVGFNPTDIKCSATGNTKMSIHNWPP